MQYVVVGRVVFVQVKNHRGVSLPGVLLGVLDMVINPVKDAGLSVVVYVIVSYWQLFSSHCANSFRIVGAARDGG